MERVRTTILTPRYSLIILLLLALSGCYHMRMVPEPLEKVQVTSVKEDREALEAIASVLKEDGFEVEYLPGYAGIVTGLREFFTDNGPGQPVEGRHYFCRLRVVINDTGSGTEVLLEPFALEMQSHYVYESEGNLHTLLKKYPYETYPGMFELGYVSRELARVKEILKRNL